MPSPHPSTKPTKGNTAGPMHLVSADLAIRDPPPPPPTPPRMTNRLLPCLQDWWPASCLSRLGCSLLIPCSGLRREQHEVRLSGLSFCTAGGRGRLGRGSLPPPPAWEHPSQRGCVLLCLPFHSRARHHEPEHWLDAGTERRVRQLTCRLCLPCTQQHQGWRANDEMLRHVLA